MARSRRKSKPHGAISALNIAPTEWGVCSGYGRTSFSLVKALQHSGLVPVKVIGRPTLVGVGPDLDRVQQLYEAENGNREPDTVLHIGAPPDYKLVKGVRNVAMCWWPFSKIPPGWSRSLYGIESFIVPSPWCADGADFPNPNQRARIATLGVDGDTFAVHPRVRDDVLRLMFFDTQADTWQSGGDIAIEAFTRAFPARREDVSLDVWSTRPENLNPTDERVNLRRHIGDDGDLVRLYHRYDGLIASQRGSAFGLVPTEAMATGMPVFHSGQGGYEGFADLGVLTGSHKRPVLRTVHDLAECFEPLTDVLAEQLRQFDLRYDEFQAKALEDAITVRTRFSWESTARDLLEALSSS